MTLPALIYAQMGSYRIDAAAASALVLALFAWPSSRFWRSMERGAMIRLEKVRFRYEDMAMFDLDVAQRRVRSPSSGRAAPASRRCCRSSPASSAAYPAASCSTART